MEPNFRSHETQQQTANLIYRAVFAESPNAYLVMTPDLMIVNANDAYLEATGSHRDELVDRFVFDVFPNNPNDPSSMGVQSLSASFDRARQQRRRDRLGLQRFDICHNGVWQQKFWFPSNWPVIDEEGRIVAVVHHVREARISPNMGGMVEHARRLLDSTTALADDLQEAVTRLAAQRD